MGQKSFHRAKLCVNCWYQWWSLPNISRYIRCTGFFTHIWSPTLYSICSFPIYWWKCRINSFHPDLVMMEHVNGHSNKWGVAFWCEIMPVDCLHDSGLGLVERHFLFLFSTKTACDMRTLWPERYLAIFSVQVLINSSNNHHFLKFFL